MKTIFSLLYSLLFTFALCAKEVHYLDQNQICKDPYTNNAILRKDPLFVDDFLTLHALLKSLKPHSVFEIGTCTGEGTLIIKNAIEEGVVYSLDLPPEESSYDIQGIGNKCYLPYVQIIGNSLTIDYTQYYPIDAWFIDGAHDYSHVFYETQQALLSNSAIIIWHDADIPEVFEGIKDGLEYDANYILFRVKGTRIAFSIPRTSPLLEIIND